MKNWKTTVAGLLTAVALPTLQMISTGTTNTHTIGLSIGIAFIGWFAKDAGVSGTEK
tara:strand:+ start:192 stop:362 length:171 start_codon:yes stop_codon:yes gene_type:complete